MADAEDRPQAQLIQTEITQKNTWNWDYAKKKKKYPKKSASRQKILLKQNNSFVMT